MSTAHNAKVTTAGVLALLRTNPGIGFSAEEVAAVFGASASAGGNMCRRLLASGDIQCGVGSHNLKLYHIGPLRSGVQRVAQEKPAGEPVGAFKKNVWTPPLRGYEAGLRAFADRAMAGRA